MKSDATGFSEVSAPLTAEAQALGARKKERKKENRQPKGGMGGRHAENCDVSVSYYF